MSKERLEELKKDWEYIYEMKVYDFAYPEIIGKIIEELTKQNKRVQDLEETLEHWQSGRTMSISTKHKIDKLGQQNKRYRDLLEKIHRLAGINKGIDHDLWKLVRDELEGE